MKLSSAQLVALKKEPGPNRLAAAIRLAETTQESLAAALDISQPRVSELTGATDVRLSMARRIASAFGCTVDDLFPARAGRKVA